MGIFDGCLLACDVDGTLISGEIFPKRNFEAIDYFKSEGGTVCLATGRTAAALTPIIERYGGFGPSVVANGSMIYDIEKDSVLFEKCLTDEDKQLTLDMLSFCPTAAAELHCGKRVVVINRTNESDDHERYEKIPTTFAEKPAIFGLNLQKVLLLFGSEAERTRTTEYLKGKKCGCAVTLSTALIENKRRYYLEILPAGISKAATLKKLCELKKINREKFFAIGDYYNDLEMIENAFISACPVTSPQDVKDKADYTVGAPENGSVADFIDILKGELTT